MSFGKHIPSKDIPSGSGEPLKEKNMLEEKNEKQVRTSIGEPLKKKEMPKDKKGKQVRTYDGVISTRKLSNEMEN